MHVQLSPSKETMLMCFLFFVLLLIACEIVDAECTYPVRWTNNTYYDNEKGPVTFSGNTMEGWQVTLTTIQKTVSSWECYQRNGSIIVSKNKEKMMMYGITFYAFVCMVVDFKESYFFYKLWSAEEARADGERVKIKTQSHASLCEICDKDFIPDTSEIKYMCTLETCDNVDTSQYIDRDTVCSEQPPTTTEKTTTDQLSSKTEETTTKRTTLKTLSNQSSSRAIETTTTTTDTTTQQPSSGSTATTATTTATSKQQPSFGSTAATAITTATSTQQHSSGSTEKTATTTAATQQPSFGSTATTAITTATSTQQPSSRSISRSASMITSNQQPEDLSTTASIKPSTSYVSYSATPTYQSTPVDMESSSAALQSNSSTLFYTSTTLVHISSDGSSTDNLLPDKTSMNPSRSSSSKPDHVQTTTKDLFKILSTKTDGMMTSLSTTNRANSTQISTTNVVTANEIRTSSRSNDKQIKDTSGTTPSFSSIVSNKIIPDESSVPSLSAKSPPDSEILSIFTSEALVICAVLSILILSVTLVSISIALKRKKSSSRRHRRLTYPSHIKPMYHGRHDFYYHP